MRTFVASALAAATSATLLSNEDYAFIQHIAKYALSFNTIEEFQLRAQIF
jgi:hypothetical protein